MRLPVTCLLTSLALSAGAAFAADPPMPCCAKEVVQPFSGARAGPTPPAGWQVVKITDSKKPTQYDIVDDGGTAVLHAKSDGAATALAHRVAGLDMRTVSTMKWRWKVSSLIDGADNSVAAKEDSPVRVMLEFDGDKSKLSLVERSFYSFTKSTQGRDLPYATLMYVWSNKAPVGTVIPNPHTKRIQMVVASSGPAGVGAWQVLSRNVAEDYKRAFGEDAGPLTAVGVMSDTDNTGASVEAWYGDIRFEPR